MSAKSYVMMIHPCMRMRWYENELKSKCSVWFIETTNWQIIPIIQKWNKRKKNKLWNLIHREYSVYIYFPCYSISFNTHRLRTVLPNYWPSFRQSFNIKLNKWKWKQTKTMQISWWGACKPAKFDVVCYCHGCAMIYLSSIYKNLSYFNRIITKRKATTKSNTKPT